MRLLILSSIAVLLAAVAVNDDQMLRMFGSGRGPIVAPVSPGAGSTATQLASAGAVALATPQPAQERRPANRSAALPAEGYRNPLSGVDRESFSEIVARPLFSPTRRPPRPVVTKSPPKPAVAKPPPPKAPPLRLTLVGVVAGTDQPIALLRDHATRRTLRVSVGDNVRGWRVETIESAMVRVGHKRWKRSLALYAK